jgi:CHAT domain-containing protein
VPSASHLLLHPADASDTGQVTVNEIRGLPLKNVELVTLSACQAALGQGEPRGMAITNLSDGFLMAGAKSVIGTLWEVDDNATAELMVEFYRRLTGGECKGAALRSAQISLLRTRDFSHPYFWSGLSLFGSWSDLKGGRAACKVNSTGQLAVRGDQ